MLKMLTQLTQKKWKLVNMIIPSMIRVVMQNVGDMGANAIIKIDDLTMNWTNNGVWRQC